MLARAEPFTKAHIKLWLASQPARRRYYWPDPSRCACGLYEQSIGERISQDNALAVPENHGDVDMSERKTSGYLVSRAGLHYGPFAAANAAADWIEENSEWCGPCEIVPIYKPESKREGVAAALGEKWGGAATSR